MHICHLVKHGEWGRRRCFVLLYTLPSVLESVTVTSSDITLLLKYTFLIRKSDTQGSAELGSVLKCWVSEAGRKGLHVDSTGPGGLPGGAGSELDPGG